MGNNSTTKKALKERLQKVLQRVALLDKRLKEESDLQERERLALEEERAKNLAEAEATEKRLKEKEEELAKRRKELSAIKKEAASIDAVLNTRTKEMRSLLAEGKKSGRTEERAEQEKALSRRKNIRKALFKNNYTIKEKGHENTIEYKAHQFARAKDLANLTGDTSFLQKNGTENIPNTLQTEEEAFLFAAYLQLYSDIEKYRKRLSEMLKNYKVKLSELVSLLDRWDNYDQTARSIESLSAQINALPSIEYFRTMALFQNFDNEEVKYKMDGDKVKADIFIDGGLYSKIQEQAKTVQSFFAELKAYDMVIMNYIVENSFAGFLPIELTSDREDIEKGMYLSDLIRNKRYLRSTLNEKKQNGEPITEEDELCAVVPDYNETDPDPQTLEYCATGLKAIRNGL